MRQRGFTLIELSIVLVIIGLIVGGVLVGRDLISSAAVRAQITQIEKFNQAANTFRGKYGYLPGDIPAQPAAQFGFAARGTQQGEGDGNGIIEGIAWTNGSPLGEWQAAGETTMFWTDLSFAGLIPGNYTQGTSTTFPGGGVVGNTDITGSALDLWLPKGAVGQGNYVYVWSASGYSVSVGSNYFGLSAVISILAQSANGTINSGRGLTVAQAYNIDSKIDDGLPQTGRVITELLNHDQSWTDYVNALYSPPSTAGTAANFTTCYDNGGVAGPQHYSLTQNNGAGMNCALSFRFQ
jgi:prepilin-type N-terminal cleavage/methylation domain-containing protein